MAFEHRVRLLLGNPPIEADVWDEYTIAVDMLRAGGPFTFTLWYSKDRRAAWNVLLESVKCFDPVRVAIDDALVLNGQIEMLSFPASRTEGARIIVNGRDLAGPAVDFDVSPRLSLTQTTVEAAIRQVFEPLGVTVVTGLDPEAVRISQQGAPQPNARRTRTRRQPVDRTHPQIGERMWNYAQRLAQRAGLLMWVGPLPDGGMGVMLDVPEYDWPPEYQFTRRIDAQGRVTQDSNILDGAFTVSVANIPTEVFVYGHGARGDGTPARVCTHLQHDRFNERFVRRMGTPSPNLFPPRPRHVRANRARSPDQTRQQASRIVDAALVDHEVYTMLVQGHGQVVRGRSLLYAVNTMCRIRDDLVALDGPFLITRCEFRRSRKGGTFTSLVCSPKDAIRITPDPEV